MLFLTFHKGMQRCFVKVETEERSQQHAVLFVRMEFFFWLQNGHGPYVYEAKIAF